MIKIIAKYLKLLLIPKSIKFGNFFNFSLLKKTIKPKINNTRFRSPRIKSQFEIIFPPIIMLFP